MITVIIPRKEGPKKWVKLTFKGDEEREFSVNLWNDLRKEQGMVDYVDVIRQALMALRCGLDTKKLQKEKIT